MIYINVVSHDLVTCYVITYKYKGHISSTPNYFIKLSSILPYLPSKFLATTLIQTTSINYLLVDKKIDHFIEMIKSLALLVQIV